MLAQFSACSLLQESEPETWKTSFQQWEKSVYFQVIVIFNPAGLYVETMSEMVTVSLQVRDVRMISDRNSRRSKGIAYIEFVEASSVPLAIGLTGQRLLGVPIIVQASQVMVT